MFRSLTMVLLLGLGSAAQTPDVAKLHPQGYVNDFAHVVDAQSKQRIEQICGSLERSTGAQLAVVTVPTLGREPIEDFTNQLFRSWGVGRKANKGAMLLLAIQDRRQRLEVGYGLEPLLPDGFAGSILRTMRPELGQSQYGHALYEGTRVLALRVAEKSGAKLDDPGPVRVSRRIDNSETSTALNWPLTLLGLLFRFGPFVVVAIILIKALRRRTALYTGVGGWSGGGFGGYDSGGSSGGSSYSSDSSSGSDFGGFGGGDSGGGGASSDW